MRTSSVSDRSQNLSDSRGNRLGIGIFRVLLGLGGLRPARWLARAVTWFYARFDPTAREAAEPYLKLRFPEDADDPRALRRHFRRLLAELADGLILAHWLGSGRRMPIVETGRENLPVSGGVVAVLAHFGCWQASMRLLNDQSGRPINVMARPDHNANMDKFLALGGERKFNVISTEEFSGGLIAASAALDRGEAVIVMGDRPVEGSATAEAEFFGGRIELPLSPWLLAARNGVPAVPVFAELSADGRSVEVRYLPPETFPAAEGRVRPDALGPCVKRYAGLLEEAARRSPYRVFRFGSEKSKR